MPIRTPGKVPVPVWVLFPKPIAYDESPFFDRSIRGASMLEDQKRMEYLLGKSQHIPLALEEIKELRTLIAKENPAAKDYNPPDLIKAGMVIVGAHVFSESVISALSKEEIELILKWPPEINRKDTLFSYTFSDKEQMLIQKLKTMLENK